jgi:hypothetical protein
MTEEDFNHWDVIVVDALVAKYLGYLSEVEDPFSISVNKYNRISFPKFTRSLYVGSLLIELVQNKRVSFILKYDYILKSYVFGFNEDRLYIDELLPVAICKAICCEFY